MNQNWDELPLLKSVEYVLDKSEKSKQQGQVLTPMQAFERKESEKKWGTNQSKQIKVKIILQEIDFATLPIGPSIEVWYRVDLTSIAFQELYNLVVPWPQEEGRLANVIRPFNLIVFVWITYSNNNS